MRVNTSFVPRPNAPSPSSAPTAHVPPTAEPQLAASSSASPQARIQLGAEAAPGPAPTWTAKPVSFNASTMFLLTDGRVLAEDEGATNNGSKNWYILTPDQNGSYANGAWQRVASSAKDRIYYASAVLPDGRVLAIGGEYTGGQQTEDTAGEIYDPVKNTWSPISSPPGWSQVGDASSALLPDGRLLVGSIGDNKTALYDPKTDTWTDAGAKLAPSAEETWVLLPSGQVLTVDCDPSRPQQSELWTPGKGWTDAGKLPVALVQAPSQEIGPGTLLDDGRVFFVGATGHTALYAPSTTGAPGTWSAGPEMPKDGQGNPIVAKDAPSVLLPNGHVLFAASSLGPDPSGFGNSASFFEFDPSNNSIRPAASAPDGSAQPPFESRFLQLPSGETMFANGGTSVSFAPPSATPPPSFRPLITAAPASAAAGETLTIAGLRLNGMSQTVGYGDDASAATNYPLVRLTDPASGHVFYARTHDHSTMGVATGDAPESTLATLPAGIPPGAYRLEVVANGIASDPVMLTVR